MVDDERWSYGQVFRVMRDLLSVDSVCLVPLLVYVVSRYIHFVRHIPSVCRLDVSASVGGGREEPGSRDCGRRTGGSVVPYVPCVPPRAEGL